MIAKIEGATYAQVMSALGLTSNASSYKNSAIVLKSNLDKDDVSESNLILELDAFRGLLALNNYNITTYSYNPLIGVTSITSPNGLRVFYKYDSSGRLSQIKDSNGIITNEYNYNYKQ